MAGAWAGLNDVSCLYGRDGIKCHHDGTRGLQLCDTSHAYTKGCLLSHGMLRTERRSTLHSLAAASCCSASSCVLPTCRAGVGIPVPHAAGAPAGLPVTQSLQQHQRAGRLPVHQQLWELHGWFQLRCAVSGRCSEWQCVRLRSTWRRPLTIIAQPRRDNRLGHACVTADAPGPSTDG